MAGGVGGMAVRNPIGRPVGSISGRMPSLYGAWSGNQAQNQQTQGMPAPFGGNPAPTTQAFSNSGIQWVPPDKNSPEFGQYQQEMQRVQQGVPLQINLGARLGRTSGGNQEFYGTEAYNGPNDPGGTPGYNGQPQTPWQQRQNYPSGVSRQRGASIGQMYSPQTPYWNESTGQYTSTPYGHTTAVNNMGEPETYATTMDYRGPNDPRYQPGGFYNPIGSNQQPGSQYYNPYYGSISNSDPSTMNQPLSGYGQQQQPMQINLGALMQRLSNPQSKTPQGPGSQRDIGYLGPQQQQQMNQMQRRRRPSPSYMPQNTIEMNENEQALWNTQQSGGGA